MPLPAILCLAALLSTATASTAQEVAEQPEVETIAENLARPCDLALRLGGSRSGPNLMVAEGDTGRVLGLSTEYLGGGLVEIIEPAADHEQWGDARILFRSRNRMLIGQAAADGSTLRVVEFDIDDDALPMSRDQQKLRYDYQPSDGSVQLTGMTRDASVLVLSTGSHQWLLKAKLRSGPPAKLENFVRTQDVTELGTPRIVKFSHKGYLVVVESGSDESATESLLVFYHPVNMAAEPLMKMPIKLTGVVSIAYSTATGNLYVANQSSDAAQAGIYRLDAQLDASTGQQSCEEVRVLALEDPTAIVFDDSGAMFITTAGDEDKSNGKLLRIASGM